MSVKAKDYEYRARDGRIYERKRQAYKREGLFAREAKLRECFRWARGDAWEYSRWARDCEGSSLTEAQSTRGKTRQNNGWGRGGGKEGFYERRAGPEFKLPNGLCAYGAWCQCVTQLGRGTVVLELEFELVSLSQKPWSWCQSNKP